VVHKVVEEIIEENNWRDGDFARIKMNATGVDEGFWCRLAIPLIYAHWEGYVVSALKLTLAHLNSLELQTSCVPTHMIVLCLGDSYKSLGGKQSFDQRIVFTEKFNDLLSKSMKFATKIETKSNLKSSVLSDLCNIFRLRYSKFGEVIGDIDRLVNVRNAIAHGENSVSPDMVNVLKYIEAVKAAMEIFSSEIDYFLTETKYMKTI
jgi:hypothetical protein